MDVTVSIRRIATSINSVHVEWCLSKEIIMAGGPQGLETPGSPQQTPQSPTIQGSPIQLIRDNLASLFQSKFPILSERIQAPLNFRGIDFRDFGFNTV